MRTIENLIKNAIPVHNWMVCCMPEIGGTLEYRLNLGDLNEFHKMWNFNGGLLAFSKSGDLYLVKNSPEVQNTLLNEGYKFNYNLAVPFSSGQEYPKAYAKQLWQMRHAS